jgi:hypothetical protein
VRVINGEVERQGKREKKEGGACRDGEGGRRRCTQMFRSIGGARAYGAKRWWR